VLLGAGRVATNTGSISLIGLGGEGTLGGNHGLQIGEGPALASVITSTGGRIVMSGTAGPGNGTDPDIALLAGSVNTGFVDALQAGISLNGAISSRSGQTAINASTLSLNGGVTVIAGGTLALTHQSAVPLVLPSLTLTVSSGSLALAGLYSTGSLNLEGGNLGGSGSLALLGGQQRHAERHRHLDLGRPPNRDQVG
jgi:hypothetical protein